MKQSTSAIASASGDRTDTATRLLMKRTDSLGAASEAGEYIDGMTRRVFGQSLADLSDQQWQRLLKHIADGDLDHWQPPSGA